MFKLNPRPYPRKAGLRGFTPGQRARALENDISALGMSSPTIDIDAGSPEAAVSRARVWLADGQKLEMLASHESRIRRGIGKSEEQLKECQAERKATCNQALEEAKLLAPLAIAEGEIYGQKENGFGFSNGEIVRLVRRDMRFQEAARLKEHGRQRPVQTPKAA
jgi:hypothetical protein